MKIPECGVVITEGLPGSGKSFFEMSRALDVVVHERRPVFTNLPLRWRVVRQWLRGRGGEALAGLIYPLTERHFRAFLSRCAKRSAMRDRLRTEAASGGRAFSEHVFERCWYAEAGPDIFRGPDANWIWEGSVIVIDEGHHWFPMRGQKEESAEVLGYLSMLRHSIHMLRIITQDRMQVSITFRRLCSSFWHVRQRGDDKVAWGIKFRHLGLTGFAYVRRTPDQEEAFGKSADVQSAFSESDVIFPWMPTQKWKFRLYDSFTHVGGLRRMRNQMVNLRRRLGVASPEEIKAARKLSKGEKVRLILKCLFWVVAMIPVFCVGYGAGRAFAPKPAPAIVAAAAEAAKPWWGSGKLKSLSKAGASVDSKLVAKGGSYGRGKLFLVDLPKRRSLWVADSSVWVWKLGTEHPTRTSSVGDFEAGAKRALEAHAARLRARDAEASGSEATSVEPAKADVVR